MVLSLCLGLWWVENMFVVVDGIVAVSFELQGV